MNLLCLTLLHPANKTNYSFRLASWRPLSSLHIWLLRPCLLYVLHFNIHQYQGSRELTLPRVKVHVSFSKTCVLHRVSRRHEGRSERWSSRLHGLTILLDSFSHSIEWCRIHTCIIIAAYSFCVSECPFYLRLRNAMQAQSCEHPGPWAEHLKNTAYSTRSELDSLTHTLYEIFKQNCHDHNTTRITISTAEKSGTIYW